MRGLKCQPIERRPIAAGNSRERGRIERALRLLLELEHVDEIGSGRESHRARCGLPKRRTNALERVTTAGLAHVRLRIGPDLRLPALGSPVWPVVPAQPRPRARSPRARCPPGNT